MFNPQHDRAIVLRRVAYEEADRIVSVLTEHSGKLSLMAKGSRKSRSKLAGGIELLALNEIGFLKGKRDIGTLVSSRMLRSWPNIAADLDRTMFAYSLIKRVDKITEDSTESEFYYFLINCLDALDDLNISLNLVDVWSSSQLLKLSGQQPNLTYDVKTKKALNKTDSFAFDLVKMGFYIEQEGIFDERHIKTFRLLLSNNNVERLSKIIGLDRIITDLSVLLSQLSKISSNA